MNRTLSAVIATLFALPLCAQAPEPPAADTSKVVAVINNEKITQAKLDQMYSHVSAQMRAEYDENGGKAAFLDNYLRKRLLLQEAAKTGFDKRPDVQADMESAKEAALFDRYVRDVVAAPIITDADVKKYYDEHPSEFARSEQVKVRHLVVVGNGAGPRPKTKEQAMELIQQIAGELLQKNALPPGVDPAGAARIRLSNFAEEARRYSEDGSAQQGGDLGWNARGVLDPTFEEAAFNMRPGIVSGIIETRFGYHLIFVEDKKPAGQASFDEVKGDIRESLFAQRAADVMQAVARLTKELQATSKIAVYSENIK
ncbi:MAG: peptidyl-prolyl cis-trans isomerase [Thermoanaerobaculia bacterium]